MPLVLLASWIIAGLMSAWAVQSITGVERGSIIEWTAGVAGGVVGALLLGPLLSLLLQPAGTGLDWWFSTPAAFFGGILAITVVRVIPRVRRSP